MENKKMQELTDEQLKKVSGGADPKAKEECMAKAKETCDKQEKDKLHYDSCYQNFLNQNC